MSTLNLDSSVKAIDHGSVNAMFGLPEYLDYLFADDFAETIVNNGDDFVRLIVNGQKNSMSLKLALHFAAWVATNQDYYVQTLVPEQVLKLANSLKAFEYTYSNADCDYFNSWYGLVYSLPLRVICSYVSFNRWSRPRGTADIRF